MFRRPATNEVDAGVGHASKLFCTLGKLVETNGKRGLPTMVKKTVVWLLILDFENLAPRYVGYVEIGDGGSRLKTKSALARSEVRSADQNFVAESKAGNDRRW